MKLNCKQQTPCKISGIKICQACFKTSQKFNWKVQFKLETYITHEIEMEQGRNQNRVTTTVLASGDFLYLQTIFETLMNGQISNIQNAPLFPNKQLNSISRIQMLRMSVEHINSCLKYNFSNMCVSVLYLFWTRTKQPLHLYI